MLAIMLLLARGTFFLLDFDKIDLMNLNVEGGRSHLLWGEYEKSNFPLKQAHRIVVCYSADLAKNGGQLFELFLQRLVFQLPFFLKDISRRDLMLFWHGG